MKKLIAHLKDERGVETLEWIVVGALIVGVAGVVYGFAGTGLKEAITTIIDTVKGTATAAS
jgi:hypothetical protein